LLFVGDDWAEDHHDVEIQDEAGRRLAKARLPEGVAGVARLHDLLGRHMPEDAGPARVVVGIETDRGPWVQALVAAGYRVYAVNPLQLSRYREGHATSGAKSDAADARSLADMMRTTRHQLRPVAGDSDLAEGIKITSRAHQNLVWERTRHTQRLRSALREYFPAAIEAFEDLDAPDTLELLAKAPTPAAAAKLTRAQVAAVLKRARRRTIAEKTTKILTVLRGEQLPQPPATTAAYAATVRAEVAVLTVLNAEIAVMEVQVEAHFGRHPDAEVYLSQPGLGPTLAARVLGEFGDVPHR
jgi:transposase